MENPTSIRRLLARTACIFLAALLLCYPLSIGPAVYVMETHRGGITTPDYVLFNRIYYPLYFIVGKVPVLATPLSRYLDYWRYRALEDRWEREP